MSTPLGKPLPARDQLNSYILQLERRLRLAAIFRGAAIFALAAVASTLLLVVAMNALAFSRFSLTGARFALLVVLGSVATLGLVFPLLRLNRRQAATTAESAFPNFEERLVTFAERDRDRPDPFLELLAADTLELSRGAEPSRLVPGKMLLMPLGAAFTFFAVLLWMILAGPGYLRYGAGLLWTGPQKGGAPLYDIRVTPGDASVRRNADQLVTAQPIGIQTDRMRLYARYESASKWEQLSMQPEAGASGFQFVFAGLPEGVEYYVQAGALRSRHFNLRVVDLPSVKQISVTYRYPSWTALPNAFEERGGDLRAVEGTEADLAVVMDRPVHDGLLLLDTNQQIRLSGGTGNVYKATIHLEKDGAYHVAALDQGQPVRLSQDFFIEANKANPPEVRIDRPDRDYRASPIEEVTISVKADDAFGLNEMSLHYSVNGGAEQIANLLTQKGAKEANGSATLYLENFKLIPGDLVSFYATAKDARVESHTDMFFIQAEPFEREFSQSQQMAAGGPGGAGGQADQNDISQREKEIIASTWKQQGDRAATQQQAGESGKFLSEVQSKLADQARSLSFRMQSRELSQENESFNSFVQDMNAAADAMVPAAGKLRQLQWRDAIPAEQKALQHLLRAEATFRQIEVAFGQGGGGGGTGAGRDLASLFDLELDTEKNQYETAQTASPGDQRSKDIDEALRKLDELARRQDELAQQRTNNAQDLQQRWQQEMLRRDEEELQRQIEQLANQNGQGQQSASGGTSQSNSAQSGQQTGPDPRIQQALERLRQANDEMRRASSQQQNNADARSAADKLREATNLLGGMQQQQDYGRLDSMGREATRLSGEERDQADRIHRVFGEKDSQNAFFPKAYTNGDIEELQKLANERQRMADDLSRLEKQMRDVARDLASNQRSAAMKLRDALSGMDQSDLQNHVQKSADWLRRGVDPSSNSIDPEILQGLQHLSDQLRQAQQAFDQTPGNSRSQSSETALNRVERLRNQLEGWRPNTTSGSKASGAQQGERGQDGQEAPSANYGGSNGQTRGRSGADTGNNAELPQPAAPDNSLVPPDPEHAIEQGLNELNQLRQALQDDPQSLRQVQDLIGEMQHLDPSRFRGNPELVEQLHSQVLNDVDKLELQLERESQSGQVRSSDSTPIPPGYQDAVAEYFRRLSKEK